MSIIYDFGKDPFVRRVILREIDDSLRLRNIHHQEKEDLVQEVYARCIERIEGYRSSCGHFNPFLVAVVKGNLSKILRERFALKRISTHRVSLSKLIELEDGSLAEFVEMLDQDDQDRRIGREHRLSEVELANLEMDIGQEVSKLPEHLRQFLTLYKYYSMTEVSRLMNVPRTTIYGWLRQVRRHFENTELKKYLEE